MYLLRLAKTCKESLNMIDSALQDKDNTWSFDSLYVVQMAREQSFI